MPAQTYPVKECHSAIPRSFSAVFHAFQHAAVGGTNKMMKVKPFHGNENYAKIFSNSDILQSMDSQVARM